MNQTTLDTKTAFQVCKAVADAAFATHRAAVYPGEKTRTAEAKAYRKLLTVALGREPTDTEFEAAMLR